MAGAFVLTGPELNPGLPPAGKEVRAASAVDAFAQIPQRNTFSELSFEPALVGGYSPKRWRSSTRAWRSR